jgi:broad specificity phosphatase PhoE
MQDSNSMPEPAAAAATISHHQRLANKSAQANIPAEATGGSGSHTSDSSSASSSSSSSSAPPSSKTIYFIRHAESAYNAHKLRPYNWLTLRALKDPMIFDPPLSPRGLQQLIALSAVVSRWSLRSKAQLVICSPLKRAIDTAMAVEGEEFNIAMAGGKQSPASPLPVPVFVSPLCAEIVDTSADIGSSPSLLSSLYPALSFSHLPSAWWYHKDVAHPRAIDAEPAQRVEDRVDEFLMDLWSRAELSIIVVSHSSFIRKCTTARLKIANCCVQECRMDRGKDGKLRLQIVRERLN